MRKLREVVVVGAMVGGISMLGAGVAFAGGHDEELPTVNCTQEAGDNTAAPQTGLINVFGPVLSGGAADSSATQQLCGIDNENATNTAGTSTGGAGGTAGVTLGA